MAGALLIHSSIGSNKDVVHSVMLTGIAWHGTAGAGQMADQKNKFYGWILVCVFFGIYFLNSSFPYYGASVINTYMARDLDMSRAALGLGYTVYSFSFALSAPIVGICVSTIGSRLTLFIGGLLIMLGALLMATITSPWQYIAVFGLIIGVGISMGSAIPIQSGVTFWFKKRKAMAMSVVLSAAGIGGLVAAPMLNKVIETFNDNWKMAWLLVAATSLISALLAIGGVRNQPEDMGQVADGVPTGTAQLSLAGAVSAVAGGVYQSADFWQVREALKTRTLWLIIMACIAFMTPYVTCVAHSVAYLQDLDHPENLAALSVGLLVFFSIIGRLAGGILGDRVEPRFIWCIAQCFVLAGMVILTHSAGIGPGSIYLYALFVGAGFGAAYVCMATIIGNYFGSRSFASIMGIIFPIIFLAAGLGPFLAGYVYDQQGSYNTAFHGLTILALIGAVTILFAIPPVRSSDSEQLTDPGGSG